MQNIEYNTYQRYQGFETMKKNIFAFVDRSCGVAEYNYHRQLEHSSDKKYFAKKIADIRTNERPKLNRVDMKEIQMRKGNKVMD
ncbi:MAG: hypothetical protein FJ186_05660 [Gammaproteobacteria bacterium]|nr:hypothetical protein [Gammaproteobacteria bacterium]